MTLEGFLNSYGSILPLGSVWAPAIALFAGVVASAVCPCTLPMGLGMAGVAGASETQSRRRGILIAFSFFAGIIVNLAILGALAGHIGAVLTGSFGKYWTFSMALMSLLAAGLLFFGPQLPVDRLAALRNPGFMGACAYALFLVSVPWPLRCFCYRRFQRLRRTRSTASCWRGHSGLAEAFHFS